MAQAQRLDLSVGEHFSDAAFSASAPADLGNRCTRLHGIRSHPPSEQRGVIRRPGRGGMYKHCAELSGTGSKQQAPWEVRTFPGRSRLQILRSRPRSSNIQGVRSMLRISFPFQAPWGLHSKPWRSSDPEILGSGSVIRCILNRNRYVPSSSRAKAARTAVPFASTAPGKRTVFQGGLCDRWELEDRGTAREEHTDLFSLRVALLDRLVDKEPETNAATWGVGEITPVR